MNDHEIKPDASILKEETASQIPASQTEILKLLQTNLARSEEILGRLKFIKKYIFWQQVGSVVRVLIILIPIVIGFIYLPPLIRDSIGSYQDLLR